MRRAGSQRRRRHQPQGPGFILIEGASQTARYRIDGCEVKFPYDQAATSPLVISTDRHVIEVHESEIVALREEIVLETGETRTRRVEGAQPE